jgi:molybdate transport system regulatory protein
MNLTNDRKPRSSLRIEVGEGLTLDSIKVALIEEIDKRGSISAAQRKLGLTYRTAWLHIGAVNRMFSRKIVVASVGGKQGRGAYVTDLGRSLAAAFRRAELRAQQATEEEIALLLDPRLR